MNLKQKLIKATKNDPNECSDIIWDLNPNDCNEDDVRTLLNLRKVLNRNKLAFLRLEADMWIRDNFAILKKRFIKQEDQWKTQGGSNSLRKISGN